MAGKGGDSAQSFKITALSVEAVARILSKSAGKAITSWRIEKDLQAKAPANPDGTINLIHYAAWLVKEMGRGGD